MVVQLPRVVRTADELRAAVAAARGQGKSIGVVPTMGALHAGHLSLVEACRRECGFTVVTVFVNPTQFGPGEDYQRYPRNLDRDLELLQSVDLVFAPSVELMYPPGHSTLVDVPAVSEPLEGRHRPGHFRGVATVVLKLFNLVAADAAFFGQKDYQQTLVVRRMVKDLDVPLEIRVCATVREADGLAMSSRNVYLSPTERRQAQVLSRSLRLAEEMVAAGQCRAAAILERMRELFAAEPAVQVQYIALVDPETLADVHEVTGPTVALVAANVGATRLIDNAMLWDKAQRVASAAAKCGKQSPDPCSLTPDP
jgi:pantoate--beta-alanine ligase